MDEVFFVILLFFRLKNEIILHSFFLFHTDSRGESTGEIQSSVCLFFVWLHFTHHVFFCSRFDYVISREQFDNIIFNENKEQFIRLR